MTTELARTTDVDLDSLQRTASMMAASGYFDAAREQRQAIAQLAVKIMAGREMGYGPFASVQGIYVIQGKPSLSANLMAAAVKGHPRYDYRVRKMDNDGVVIEFFENGESLGKSEFTAEDAKKAGTQNMNKFARNMLFARALSNGVRWYCPDVFNGNAVYSPEELGASVDDNGDVIDVPFVEQRTAEPVHRANSHQAQPEASPAKGPRYQGIDDAFLDEAYRTLHGHERPKPASQPPASLDEVEAMNQNGNEPAAQDSNPFEDAPSASDALRIQAQEIIEAAGIKSPPAAQLWAVTHRYRSNDHSARNAFKSVVDEEFGGSFKQPQMAAVIRAYIARCLRDGKKEPALEPVGPDVGDGENMPMAA